MDLFLPIVLFIVFCVLFSICGWCCKKHREGTVYGYAGNPNVTVTTQPAASVIPPYPVDPRHPQPVPGFMPAGGYQTGPYPVTTTPYPPPPGGGYHPPAVPYPVSGAGAAPYPTATPAYPPSSAAPYPPASTAPYPTHQQQPPSYMEAVGQPPAEPHPPISDGYTKQAPYNPHY